MDKCRQSSGYWYEKKAANDIWDHHSKLNKDLNAKDRTELKDVLPERHRQNVCVYFFVPRRAAA